MSATLEGYPNPTERVAIARATKTGRMTVDEYKRQRPPLESEEQQALFAWARLSESKYPELALLVAIPNGGLRNMPEAVRFKAEGVRKGFPDMILPVARGGCHALAIELKRLRGGTVSPEQKAWIDALKAQGWRAVVCKGWEAARDEIVKYLEAAL